MSKFYITTAIDYPNNKPHMGHAFEKIGADVQARYRRMQGCETWFLTGTDENTVKVSKRAAELGLAPQAYVDAMAGEFKAAWRTLGVSHDDFIQTSEARHAAGCRAFIRKVHAAGYIYPKAYEALYCEGCESFKTPKDLAGGRCPDHPAQPPRLLKEENYFFALSAFRDRLLALYRERPDFIMPETRRNEVVALVQSGLEDISITRRNLSWGIPVPFDPEQTIYVWFDALLNYITAIGYGTDEAAFRRRWPADAHVVGKDITRFHCALWPAMLMAAGVELPRRVQVHGFVTLKGEKMSKSLGNVVDPVELCDRVGPDAFRYFFMRECPFTGDGEFSAERFAAVYNADLANNLGNLFSRTLAMALRYFEGRLSGLPAEVPGRVFAGTDIGAVMETVRARTERFEYHLALADIWKQVLDPANRYIDRTKPFELAAKDRGACGRVLFDLAEVIRAAAILLKPFMPGAARSLYQGFSCAIPEAGSRRPWDEVRFEHAASWPPTRLELQVTAPLKDGKVPPLFPRIEL